MSSKKTVPKVTDAADQTVTGYKGFDKDLKCRGMQYTVGETYTHDGDVRLCESGLPFCQNPLDIFSYYPVVASRFAEIEATGVSEKTDNDTKRVARSIKIKSELTLDSVIRAGFKFMFERVDWSKAKENTSATSGDDAHSATSGNDAHSATSGNYANSATSGNYANSATSGYDAHSATSGDRAHSATSGNYANSATSGYGAHSATSGNDAIACSVGRKAAAKASLGCWIVLAEWYEGKGFTDAKPIDVKAVQVDGEKIKADTFYKLEAGKFVETE